MADVYAQAGDGTSFKLIRNRNLEDYCGHFRHQGDDLVTILLKLAQVKDTVAFYDIGCGDAHVAKSLHEGLEKRAKTLGLGEDLARKVTYFGIDLEDGNYWVTSDRKKFFRGDILEVLNNAQLPPIDLGVSLFVFPYLSRKLETLEALIRKLNRDNGKEGALLIKPFNNHQLLFVDERGERPLAVAEALSGGFAITYQGGSQLRLVATHGNPTLKVHFAGDKYDFYQFSGEDSIGYPCQKISHYHP